MTKNIELAQKAVDFLVEYPEALDMNSFGRVDKTGMRICFAATTTLVSGEGVWEKLPYPSSGPSEFWLSQPEKGVPVFARDALELDVNEAGVLFYVTSNEQLPDALEYVFGSDLDVSALRDKVGAP